MENTTYIEQKVVKQIDALSINDEKLSQGNAYIGISPFDDYYLFTIYKEVDGEDLAIDLSKLGSLYLNFYGENEEIKIINYDNVQDIDLSQGQVLFKVSKENGKKILKFKNNIFYISNRLVIDDQISDESVIYSGKFYPFNELPTIKNTDLVKKITNEANININTLNKVNGLYKTELTVKKNEIYVLTNTNTVLRNLTNDLFDEIDVIMNKLSTADKSAITTRIKKLKASHDKIEKNINEFVHTQQTSLSEKELENLVKRNNASDLTKLTSNTQIKTQI
jgi:hypothetical protein